MLQGVAAQAKDSSLSYSTNQPAEQNKETKQPLQKIGKFFQGIFKPERRQNKTTIHETANSNATNNETGNTAQSWIDEVGEQVEQFFREKIFQQEQDASTTNKQNDKDDSSKGFLTLFAGGTNEQKSESENDIFRKLFDRLIASDEDVGDSLRQQQQEEEEPSKKRGPLQRKNDFFVSELLKRTTLAEQKEGSSTVSLTQMGEIAKTLHEAMKECTRQLKDTFSSVLSEITPFTTLSMIYYLADQESKRTPSWKLQQHRFYEKITQSAVVMELHDALYLSQLAYVNTVKEFRTGLSKFQSGLWELAYGTTESLPTMPAHFLLIHKNPAPWQDEYILSVLPWETVKHNELQVTLVIRGTKNLADVFADTLLELTHYRGGHAHGGILASGKALVEEYTPKLKELLIHSGRDKIRLYIVGHSLGAGAGAIAAMEFNEIEFINVEAVGFGCPALLSRELSESTKSYITTVVSDSDIIPRMSGASMVNGLLELLDFDWTVPATEDINFTMYRADEATVFGNIKDFLPPKESVLKWSKEFFNQTATTPTTRQQDKRLSVTLIPPGNCIHFFRDGVGYTGTYTPCQFFSTVEFSRTMIEDHLVMPGYHRALVTIMRDWNQDFNFDFVHDISSIPA